MIVLSFSFFEFIGRFHPVLVHLPIGILLLAALFIGLATREKFRSLDAAIRITLFLGMVSAVASCISGFLLSKTEGYNQALLFKHQWFGIAVAFISVVIYYLNLKNRQTKWLAGAMVILVTITGHLGGSITHGSDFLTKAFSSRDSGGEVTFRKPIPNVQDAVAFNLVIKPVLEAKCIGCHGSNKQKGKLRLDEPGFILKGGEEGPAIVAEKADEGALIKRILLPKENKDHMPPMEKPQLSKQEIELLQWWTASGADFNRKVKELPQTENIKSILKSLESEEIYRAPVISELPGQAVDKAPEAAIQQLQKRGIAVVAIAQNSNYLSVNFVAAESFSEQDLRLLEPLKKQLVWLKLGNTSITDANMEIISKLSGLIRLSLEKTNITDEGIKHLKDLTHLQYLNLVGTKVSLTGLKQLTNLKNLQQLYLYQTPIPKSDRMSLVQLFPETLIDTGGYVLEKLIEDTIVLKVPQVK
jgi:uncharacterized membrane protein/mono/diheme cytochrome c family protein